MSKRYSNDSQTTLSMVPASKYVPASEYDPYAKYDADPSLANTNKNTVANNRTACDTTGLRKKSVMLKYFKKYGGEYTGDEIKLQHVFPPELFVGGRPLHSIEVTFKFKDQNWGNHKGNVYIVEVHKGLGKNGRPQQSMGRILVTSPHAPHGPSSRPCKLVYYPEEQEQGMAYGLSYKVGAGGGHFLSVKNIVVTTYTYETAAYEAREPMRKA